MQMRSQKKFTIAVEGNCLLRETQTESDRVILCVAGFGDNGAMFLPLFDTPLAENYQIAAIDLPGAGATPPNQAVKTIDDYAELVSSIIRRRYKGPVGLVGHSISSAICVAVTHKIKISGLFSIEGNLTESDAYFTGKAAKYDDAEQFWTALRADLKASQIEDPILRRYYAAAMFADPESLWLLGRDAVEKSNGNGLGKEFLQAGCKTHYYWSLKNTPDATKIFIENNKIENSVYDGSHWPTLDRTDKTADAILSFFRLQFKKNK